MIVAKVKRIRMTGLGKNKPARIANVILHNEWLGKKVFIVEYRAFIMMRKELNALRTKIRNIKIICG